MIPDVNRQVEDQQETMVKATKPRQEVGFSIGQRVSFRNYAGNAKWNFGTVTEKLGSVDYKIQSGDKTYVRHANQMLNSQITDSNEPNSTQNKSMVPVVSNNQNTNYSFINPPMYTYNNIQPLQQASPPPTSRNSITMNGSPKKDVPNSIPVRCSTPTRRTN
ncbi:hypothetical protein QE152_g39070 [Popillia japonica]|uniref:Uncharacterized protein n=1 Tax=Popillia japonica TaxID=7064 RepID=A0AAW1HV10_POPJA